MTVTARQRFAGIASATAGNLVEWFDWFVYAACALYFADDFFPKGDPTAQVLGTSAVFAAGFLMRPVGGWLMGAYADRKGRKAGLTLSVLLMCAGSLLIAITPGHAVIGNWAPALLLFARLLQSFSVGAEYGASATYLCEVAEPHNRGFYSSFQFVTLILGQLMALGLLLLLQYVFITPEELDQWGWRIPFLVGAAAAVVVFFLRRNMVETDQFQAVPEKEKAETGLRALLAHPREVMLVAGISLGGNIAFYTYTTYMQKYLVLSAGFEKSTATLINAVTLIGFMILQPLAGILSDRIGRRRNLMIFGSLGALLTVPIMEGIAASGDPVIAGALIMLALLILSFYTSVGAIVKAELFPAGVRAIGVGLPYAITVSLFGGTSEYVALWFKQMGVESGYFWYVSGCILISFMVYARMRETMENSRI